MIIESLDNPQGYLDIEIGGEKIGRIVIELFKDDAPLACDNFLKLCTGEVGVNPQGIKLSYENNYFHRSIQNFIIQAGDIVSGTDLKYPPTKQQLDVIGTGGASIFLDRPSQITDDLKLYNEFADENLAHSTFDTIFNVAMSNNDADSNTSQFFINTYPSPHLNGKHTIFGKVVHGKSVVRAIEKTSVISKETYFPTVPVKIAHCGQFFDGMDVPCFNACYDTIGGDVYEEYPDDSTNFDQDDHFKSFEVSETIKNSGNLLFKAKEYHKALLKFIKALRYIDELQPEKDVLIVRGNSEEQNNKNYKLYMDYLHLKKSVYSNLSIVYLKLEQYQQSIKYSEFLLDMLELYPKYEKLFKAEPLDFVKCYFRMGKCFQFSGRLDMAKEYLSKAKELNKGKDPLIAKDLETVEAILEKRKQSRKKNLAKFFE